MVWLYNSLNGSYYWQPWTTYITQNINQTSDPVGTGVNAVNQAVPWFFPVFLFFCYLYLLLQFKGSNSRYKWPGITLMVCIIGGVMAWYGYVPDAIAQFIAFGLAALLSTFFKT